MLERIYNTFINLGKDFTHKGLKHLLEEHISIYLEDIGKETLELGGQKLTLNNLRLKTSTINALFVNDKFEDFWGIKSGTIGTLKLSISRETSIKIELENVFFTICKISGGGFKGNESDKMTDSIYHGDISNFSRHKFASANNVSTEVSTLSNIVLNRSLGWDIEVRNLEVGIEYYSISLKRPVMLKLSIPELIVEDRTKNSTYDEDGTDTIVLEKHIRMKKIMLYLCEFLFYKGDPLDIPILEIPEIIHENLKANESNLKIHLSKSDLNLKKIDLDLHFNFMRFLVNPYNLQIIMQIAYEFLQESNVSEYLKSSFFDIKDFVDNDMKECVRIVQPNEFKNSQAKSNKIINVKAFIRKVLVTLAYENLIFPDTEIYFKTLVEDINSPPKFTRSNITLDIVDLNFHSDNFTTTILEIANLSVSELIGGESNKILFFSKNEDMVPDFKLTIANTIVDKKMNLDVKLALGQVNAIIDIELYSRLANFIFVFSHFSQAMALIIKQQQEKLRQLESESTPSMINSGESEKKEETYSSIKIKSPCVSLSLIFPAVSQNLPLKDNPIISIDCFKFKIFTRMISTNNGQEYEICFSSFNSYFQHKLEDPKIPIVSVNSMSKIETKVPLRIQTKSVNKKNKNRLSSFSLNIDDYNIGLGDDHLQTKEDEFNNLRYQAMEDSEITISLVLPPFWFEMGKHNFQTIKKLIAQLPQYFKGSHDPELEYTLDSTTPSDDELTFHDPESETEFYSGDEDLLDSSFIHPTLPTPALDSAAQPIKFGFHFVCSGGIVKLYEGDILDSNSLEITMEDLTVLFGSSLQSKEGSSLLAMSVNKLTLNYNVNSANEDQSQLYYVIQRKADSSKSMISFMIESKLNTETITSVTLIGVVLDHPISTNWFGAIMKFFQSSDDPLLENSPSIDNRIDNQLENQENQLIQPENADAKSHLELNLENISICISNSQRSSLTLDVDTVKLVNELDSSSYRFNLIFSKVGLFVSKFIHDCKNVKKKNIGQADSLNVEIILNFLPNEVGFLVSVENHDLKLFGCADSIRTIFEVINSFESSGSNVIKRTISEELDDDDTMDGLEPAKVKVEVDETQFQEVPQNLKKEFEEKYKTEILEDDVLFEQKQISTVNSSVNLQKPDHLLRNPSAVSIPSEKRKVYKEIKKMVPKTRIIKKTIKVNQKKPNSVDEEDEFKLNIGDDDYEEVEQTIEEEVTYMEEVITGEWVEEDDDLSEKKQEIIINENPVSQSAFDDDDDFNDDFSSLKEDEDQYKPPETVNLSASVPTSLINHSGFGMTFNPTPISINPPISTYPSSKSLPQIPVVRFLNADGGNHNNNNNENNNNNNFGSGFLRIIDNYILQKHKEHQKISLLPSNGFPNPNTRIVFKDITITLTIYGGEDWKDQRDENNTISLDFNKISLQYDSYYSHSRLYNRIGLTIFDIEIKDGVEDSNWLSLFSYDSTIPRPENANFFSLIMQNSFGSKGVLLKNCKIKILPIRLNIEGNTLSFLVHFFNFLFYGVDEDDLQPPPLTPEETFINEEIEMQRQYNPSPFDPEEIEIQKVVYQMFSIDKINISLNIKPLSAAKLNLLQTVFRNRMKFDSLFTLIENFPLNIADARIELPAVRITDGIPSEKLADEVVKQWDWVRRLPEVLSGIGPGHSLQVYGKGLWDLVYLPFSHYMNDGRVVTGLKRGVYSFAWNTVSETLNIFGKVTTGTVTIMENIIGNEEEENVKRRSKYAEQPRNTSEGFNQAVGVIRKRAKETANRVFHGPMKEYKKSGTTGYMKTLATGVPTAVLSPFLAVTEVVSKLSQGTYNSYNPQNIVNIQNKYK